MPKRDVAVSKYDESARTIKIYSTADAITEFAEFGGIQSFVTIPNAYYLFVDDRYDFFEVLDYIKNYG